MHRSPETEGIAGGFRVLLVHPVLVVKGAYQKLFERRGVDASPSIVFSRGDAVDNLSVGCAHMCRDEHAVSIYDLLGQAGILINLMEIPGLLECFFVVVLLHMIESSTMNPVLVRESRITFSMLSKSGLVVFHSSLCKYFFGVDLLNGNLHSMIT